MRDSDRVDRPVTVIRGGEAGRFVAQFEQLQLVAIDFAVARSIAGLTRDQVATEVRRVHPDASPGRVGQWTGQLYRFATELQEGDPVVTPDTASRDLLIGSIAGPYEFRVGGVVNGAYHHVRRVTWRGRRSRDRLSKQALFGIGSVATLFQPKAETQRELLALIRGETANPERVPIQPPDETVEEVVQDDLVADLASRSAELIGRSLARLSDNQMEDLVAGVLRAMGYFTQTASATGGDGGVDVLAARDPLFVEPPIIKVQVKHRAEKAAPADIRALAGILGDDERGIFVSMGGFSAIARDNRAVARITLIDATRLQVLLIEYYERLDTNTKALVPLRKLYFPQD